MKIMLTDKTPTSREVGDALIAAGHDVVRSCLPHDESGRCSGLDGAECSLHGGVDIALTSAEAHGDVATAGVVCATRAGVPVMRVGAQDARHPDLNAVLARRARRADPTVTASVSEALRAKLTSLGLPDGVVTVERWPDRERIIATMPEPISEQVRSRIAVSLLAAATKTDRHATKRDVAVRVAP